MKRSIRVFKRFIVGLIGFPLLAVGIVLIPLPGPGVLVSLLAFFILSLEFDWAERYFNQAKDILKKIYDQAKKKADHIEKGNG
jgi:uncharacterized protein (TIGR02611 family)